MECSAGRTQTALETIPSEKFASLRCVLRCLEGEFYSYAKQTASGLLFTTQVRQHSETESSYADALKMLAI